MSRSSRPIAIALALGVVACNQTPKPPSSLLVVDANRDGTLDLTGTTDDPGKNGFDAQHGAIVVANIDDDDSDGKQDQSDTVVNGDSDTQDLSLLAVRAWAKAPTGTSGKLTVDGKSASNLHLFKVNGAADKAASYTLVADPTNVALSTADLQGGVTFAVEATSVVTSDAADAWNGRIQFNVTLSDAQGKTLATDAAQIRVAPVLFQFNTAATETVFYTDGAGADTTALSTGLQPAITGTTQTEALSFSDMDFDQWAQDFFDVAYMSKPGPNHTFIGMRVFIRSAEPDRPAGGDVIAEKLGPDVGTLYIHGDEDPNSDGYSMNSFGDWDVIPPYTKDGVSYPLGRNIWGMGSTPDVQPDPVYQAFVRAQQVQPAVNVDSSWLTVGHVDEFFSFVKTNTPRGWGLLVGSPSMGKQMLQTLQENGNGSATLFSGLQTWDYSAQPDQNGNYPSISAQVSVDQVLANADLMAESQLAQMEIDNAVDVMKKEVGLADNEITPMPFLYDKVFGKGLAFQPGTVNLLYVDGHVAVPKPFGPNINGQDPFEQDLQMRLGAQGLGLSVSFVDDWDLYHIEMGEVHCGTNASRNMQLAWWESGR